MINIPVYFFIYFLVIFNWHCHSTQNKSWMTIDCSDMSNPVQYKFFVLIDTKLRPKVCLTALVILRGCHLQCSWYSLLANIYFIFLPDISFHLSTVSWTDLKKTFCAYSLFKKEIIVHLHEVSNNTLDYYCKVITFGVHENWRLE